MGRKRRHEWKLEDHLTPSNLPITPHHPPHCIGASQVEEIPLGRRKSRLFLSGHSKCELFSSDSLAVQRRTPSCIPSSSWLSATVSEKPVQLDGEAESMHELVLDIPNLPKEKWRQGDEKTESYAHQTRGSILALLELPRADVDMGSNGSVKPCLLLAVRGVGKGSTALLTQPEQPYQQRSTHCLTA